MARFLLDTHALLWWMAEPQRLDGRAHEAVADPSNEVFVSSINAWEIAVKHALGKLQAPDNLEASIKKQGFTPLALTFRHAEQAGALPPHHGDPFDRMLVAQAQIEGLTVVTRDRHISRYDVLTMPA